MSENNRKQRPPMERLEQLSSTIVTELVDELDSITNKIDYLNKSMPNLRSGCTADKAAAVASLEETITTLWSRKLKLTAAIATLANASAEQQKSEDLKRELIKGLMEKYGS